MTVNDLTGLLGGIMAAFHSKWLEQGVALKNCIFKELWGVVAQDCNSSTREGGGGGTGTVSLGLAWGIHSYNLSPKRKK